MLKKSTGKTTDTKGCEFSYQRLSSKERIFATAEYKESVEYVCVEFPNVSAPTLKELKERMGAL
jgi:hypothetical protein